MGNQQQAFGQLFDEDTGRGFLEFAALQRGEGAFSCIHPNASTHRPPTSSDVLVNLEFLLLITSEILLTVKGSPIRAAVNK